eukprot:COSAG01_NODE_33429_length_564_cov_1.083871_1_plen_76_part_10
MAVGSQKTGGTEPHAAAATRLAIAHALIIMCIVAAGAVYMYVGEASTLCEASGGGGAAAHDRVGLLAGTALSPAHM